MLRRHLPRLTGVSDPKAQHAVCPRTRRRPSRMPTQQSPTWLHGDRVCSRVLLSTKLSSPSTGLLTAGVGARPAAARPSPHLPDWSSLWARWPELGTGIAAGHHPAGQGRDRWLTRVVASSCNWAQAGRGEYMITATPTRQSSAPATSCRSGLNPSATIPHSSDPATKTPP